MISTSEPRVPLAKKIRAHIELADPITWISATLLVFCGAIASGSFEWGNPQHWGLAFLASLMAGPLGTGFSQSINDYYDRELDAINDPDRPIPAGMVTLSEARANWIVLGSAAILISFVFGEPLIVLLAVFGVILSAAYSIPPIKLKRHFWLGPPAVGIGYVTMSWLAGHLILAPLTTQSVIVAVVNAGIATGLLFLNDIKSIEGDRKHGLQSLTVALGIHRSLLVAYATINVCQIILMLLAFVWGYVWVGLFMLFALVVPIYSQIRLYQEPNHENFKRYILATNPFVVLIEFVSAFLVGGYFG